MLKDNKIFIKAQLTIAEEELLKSSITMVKTANESIISGANFPESKKLFSTFWHSEELTLLASDPGCGKSAIATQICDAITKNKKSILNQVIEDYEHNILYADFELSDRQWYKRYNGYEFSDRFFRLIFNPESTNTDCISFEVLKKDLDNHNAKCLILDNITALSLKSTEESNTALDIMKGLKSLTRQGYSVLVLAHIPKTIYGKGVNINSLAGSKILANLADSVWFMARSKKGSNYRFIKQVKARSSEEIDDVVVIKLDKQENFLGFEFVEYGDESEHLIQDIYLKDESRETIKAEVKALRREGLSYREISAKLGISKSKAERLDKE